MIGLLQRVTQAQVAIAGERIASIGAGLLVFLGIEKGDDRDQAERLLERVLSYRVFSDASGKMNLDVRAAGGAVLLVPQFTLAADTSKGTRASFTTTAAPDVAAPLFAYFVECARAQYRQIEVGRFGADMQVALVNDGPVTFSLRTPPAAVPPAPNAVVSIT